MPVLSKAALVSFAQLKESSVCDNVLLEYQLALELRHRGDLRAIFPVLVGELDWHNQLGNIYGDFFQGGGKPACHSEVVQVVEDKLKDHLQRLGKGAPQMLGNTRTVKTTLDMITANQGVKLAGMRTEATNKVVDEIIRHCSSTWQV